MPKPVPIPKLMPTIQVNGVEVATPFAHLWHPLTVAERAGLEERIAKVGIRQPVLLYTSPTWGESLIDGLNRCEIGLKLNKYVPHAHLGKMTDLEAWEEATSANENRRQSTAAQIAAVHKKRIEEVLALKRQGKSTRAIAKAVGTSQTQVLRDVKKAGEPSPGSPAVKFAETGKTVLGADQASLVVKANGSVVDVPEKVTGTDGKVYPAAKPRVTRISGPLPVDPVREVLIELRDGLEKLTEGIHAILDAKVIYTGDVRHTRDALDFIATCARWLRSKIKCNEYPSRLKSGVKVDPPWVLNQFTLKPSKDNHRGTEDTENKDFN